MTNLIYMQDGDIVANKKIMRDVYLKIRQDLRDISSQKDVSLPFSFTNPYQF